MTQPGHIGEFVITSTAVVVTDPGYDIETAAMPGLGAIYDRCANGVWSVHTTSKLLNGDPRLPIPDVLIASHESTRSKFAEPTVAWETFSETLGGDHAMIGIYDRTHFHDDQIIPQNYQWKFGGYTEPADPSDLWYSYNCEVIPPRGGAAVLPYGCVLHWDGGVRVSIARDKEGRVVLFKFKTSG